MTEQRHQPADPQDAGTGLAPGDLDDVLGELEEAGPADDGSGEDDALRDDGSPAAEDAPREDDESGEDDAQAPDGAARADDEARDGDAPDGDDDRPAPSGGGSDRQRLAEFARGFDAGAGEDAEGGSSAGPAPSPGRTASDGDTDAAPTDADDAGRVASKDTTANATNAPAPDAAADDADAAPSATERPDEIAARAADEPSAGDRAEQTTVDENSTGGSSTSARSASSPSSGGEPDARRGADRDRDAERRRDADDDGRTSSPALNPGEIYRIVDGKEHRDTAWSRLVSRTKELFTGSPAQEEERLDHDLEELRLRGLSQGVTLALGSIKGGAGKTTITLTLAEVLANALRVGVLVVDADLEFGTASDSVPDASRHGGTLVDVHRKRDEIHTPGDLAPYLVTLPHGAQLLSGPTDPNDIEKIDTDTMAELMELLRRFYPIILVDLPPGMGLRGSIPRWGFAEADDIVLVTTPKRANVKQMGHMLDYVSERHEGVPLTLAINMVPSRLDEAGQRVVGVAQSNGRSRRTAEIPEDPVLSRQLDAGALDIAGLDQRTRIAVKDLTYALASQWCR
jgi:MinD-like ATPase involved in chromosome partitioning or flagellar assembly